MAIFCFMNCFVSMAITHVTCVKNTATVLNPCTISTLVLPHTKHAKGYISAISTYRGTISWQKKMAIVEWEYYT